MKVSEGWPCYSWLLLRWIQRMKFTYDLCGGPRILPSPLWLTFLWDASLPCRCTYTASEVFFCVELPHDAHWQASQHKKRNTGSVLWHIESPECAWQSSLATDVPTLSQLSWAPFPVFLWSSSILSPPPMAKTMSEIGSSSLRNYQK